MEQTKKEGVPRQARYWGFRDPSRDINAGDTDRGKVPDQEGDGDDGDDVRWGHQGDDGDGDDIRAS